MSVTVVVVIVNVTVIVATVIVIVIVVIVVVIVVVDFSESSKFVPPFLLVHETFGLNCNTIHHDIIRCSIQSMMIHDNTIHDDPSSVIISSVIHLCHPFMSSIYIIHIIDIIVLLAVLCVVVSFV